MSISNRVSTRLGTLVLFGAMLVPALVLSTVNWRDAKVADAVSSGALDPRTVEFSLLNPKSSRAAARQMLYVQPYDSARVEHLLDGLISMQPDDARNYLDRAEQALRDKKPGVAREYANHMSGLWPTRPQMLWRLGLIHSKLDDNETALEYMRRYIQSSPDDWQAAFAFATRLTDDIEHVVDRLTPPSPRHGYSKDFFAIKIFNWAYANEYYDLARIVWAKYSDTMKDSVERTRAYGWIISATGSPEEMMDFWREITDEERTPVMLVNGSFEDRLTNTVSTWETRPVDGVSYKRDSSTRMHGRNALRIRFDGKHNPNFTHLVQVIPVNGKTGKYRFTGFWRGKGVTTRSGVYLRAAWPYKGKDRMAGLKARTGTWDWERFSFEFTLPKGVDYLDIRVNRAATKNLDRFIEGDVWFDELQITPL